MLYIMGWERSGTSILSRVLSAFEGITAVGELHHLWHSSEGPPSCSCGERVETCPYWKAVGPPAIQPGAERERAVAAGRRIGHPHRAGEYLDTPRNPIRATGHNNKYYQDVVEDTYLRIARAAQAKIIVDSSKSPSFAALLLNRKRIQPLVVHLVRDPRAVAYSWRRSSVHGVSRTPTYSTTRWLLWNAMGERVRAHFRPEEQILLRYEDFAAAPQASVFAVLEKAGVNPHGSPFISDNAIKVPDLHALQGNPRVWQEQGIIEIAPDDEWRLNLPASISMWTTIFAAPLMRRYGYTFTKRQK